MGRSLEQLVNQQVLRWMEEQKAKDTPPQSEIRQIQKPMITISREFGAFGGEIGRLVAERLDAGFFAQEIVHEVAKRTDVRKQVVEALDERTQSRLQLWIDDLVRLQRFDSNDYVRSLSETVLALARHDTGVIVGRGGHLILDPERTLRVRAYAPFEHRVRYIAHRDGMSVAEARLKVIRVDEERRRFYLDHFGSDITSPLSFDILLNTSTMRLDEAVETVVHLFHQRFG